MRVVATFGTDFVPTKRRPRFGNGRTYSPKANEREEAEVRKAFKAANPGFEPLTGAVGVSIEVMRKLPKGRPKRVLSEPDTMKPDADNIAKAVLDALNGAAWLDDSQVVHLKARKRDRVRRETDLMQVAIYDMEDK